MEFRPFKKGHLRFLMPQSVQRHEHAVMLTSNVGDVLEDNFALSAWDYSTCVAAAGVVPVFGHRAIAWAMLSEDAGPHMLSVVRKIKSTFPILPYRRIEMTVRADFDAGHRLALLLGMKLETPEPMRAHGATGEDEYLYAMVK